MGSWIVVVIMVLIGLVTVGLLAALVVRKRRRGEANAAVDYRAFFFLGLCFLPMGLALSIIISPGFIGVAGLGAVYVALGLKNRDRWKR